MDFTCDGPKIVDLLSQRVASAGEALMLFDRRLTAFEGSYNVALDEVVSQELPTCVCTIYNGNFAEPDASMLRRAVALFNDVILLSASRRRIPAIELRLVCTALDDYANPIEPSGKGGRKIAEAILRRI